jgi:hypothetical protein
LEALTKLEAHILDIVGEAPTLVPQERAGQARAVLAALKDSGAVMTVAEIAVVTGVPRTNTQAYLSRMAEEGAPIVKIAKGQYQYSECKKIVPLIPRKLERTGQWGMILAALKSGGTVMTVPEIIAVTGLPSSAIYSGLHRMAKTGEILKVGDGGGPGNFGRFLHPDNQPKEIAS